MASATPKTKVTPESAREFLISISQSAPEQAPPSVHKPTNTKLANGKHAILANGHHRGGIDEYRRKLILISLLQSPDAEPEPCPPGNVAS